MTKSNTALHCSIWVFSPRSVTTHQQESPETCAELGRLLLHLGQPERATQYFERGLTAATPALPALPLPAQHRVAWRAICQK
jgi:hypothetical protein